MFNTLSDRQLEVNYLNAESTDKRPKESVWKPGIQLRIEHRALRLNWCSLRREKSVGAVKLKKKPEFSGRKCSFQYLRINDVPAFCMCHFRSFHLHFDKKKRKEELLLTSLIEPIFVLAHLNCNKLPIRLPYILHFVLSLIIHRIHAIFPHIVSLSNWFSIVFFFLRFLFSVFFSFIF